MSNIIFALPRHEYASYRDLYTLIDLSEFGTCFIDEIDPQSDNAYVITILNGEVPKGGYPDARASIHLFDLEYHLGGIPPLANVTLHAADKWYAEQIGARYTPLGSHPGLRTNINAPTATDSDAPYWDVAFIGFIQGLHRREVIRQELIVRGVRVTPMVAWGDERDLMLRSSKSYLHVHQHAHIPTIAPLRMVVAAAYKLPVISETVADAGVFAPYILQTHYHALASAVPRNQEPTMEQLLSGDPLHQFLCVDYTFRKSVEAAL